MYTYKVEAYIISYPKHIPRHGGFINGHVGVAGGQRSGRKGGKAEDQGQKQRQDSFVLLHYSCYLPCCIKFAYMTYRQDKM